MIVSPRSVLPSPLTSVTAADLVSCRAGRLGDRGVGRRRRRGDRGAGRGLPRAVAVLDDDARVDVGLGDGVGRVAVQVVDAPGRQRRRPGR